MLDQKSDETLVRSKWGTVNANRNLLGVVLVFITKVKVSRLCEIDLVSRDGKLAADYAPSLDGDLWSVKRCLVRTLAVVDARAFQNISSHVFGLFPKLRFVDKFLTELRGIVRRETHQVFLDPEELEVIEVHFVHGIKLVLELLRCHVQVGVVHVQQTHPHQSKQLATLLVAITRPVLSQAQRQIAIAPWNRRE